MARRNSNTAAEPEPISPEMDDLACSLIEYGLDALAETGSLSPTLAVDDEEGNRSLLSFDDEELDECLDEIRDRLVDAQEGSRVLEGLTAAPVRYAIAYDGAVDISGSGTDAYRAALIIEYGEHGMSRAYSAYVLYRHPGDPREFEWTDPEPAGEGTLLV